jgi:hypothetical protein
MRAIPEAICVEEKKTVRTTLGCELFQDLCILESELEQLDSLRIIFIDVRAENAKE